MELSLKQVEKELLQELKMRRKVWRRLPGFDDRFVDPSHQVRYDILKRLLEVLEFCPLSKWTDLVKAADSAKMVVQGSLDL